MMQKIGKARMLDMTAGSPAGLLLKFSLPLFLGNLLQQFYNLADTFIAGHMLGDQALAEIGATTALYGLIINFAIGLTNGFALTVSQNFGAGNQKGMKDAACWMVCLSAVSGIVLTVGFLLVRNELPALLQIPEETAEGALCDLTVLLAGVPLTMAYNLEASLLRAVGNSVTPLLFLLFSSGLNIMLDIWFMGPLGMGVQGAAAATALAQGIQRRIAPLLCSGFELAGKVVFAVWAVPKWGYPAVCVCEPVTWVVCFLFISGAVFLCREEFRDEERTEPAGDWKSFCMKGEQ